MENIKKTIDHLLERDIIYNKNSGKVDKMESFKITNDEEDQCNTQTQTQTETILHDGGDGDVESLEEFINESFYETLINKIKEEIKIAVKDELYNKFDLITKNTKNKEIDNERLITQLHKEIDYLKQDLLSKNTIINDLLKGREDININAGHFTKSSPSIIDEQPLIKDAENNTTNISNAERNDETGINKDKINERRNITIIGDSMIKHIESYKMRQGMKKNEKVFVKSFTGARTACMEDYIKPSLNHKPDVLVLHVGTNNLKSANKPEDIANDIIKLATSIKSRVNEIIISGIVDRNDQFNTKGNEVNDILKTKCILNNFTFCDNSNISRSYHTNGSGLHLNYRGTVALANNFLRCLNK